LANEQNLTPYMFTGEQSREKAAENGRKGGIASGESKRARKTLRAELEALLQTHAIDKNTGKQSERTIQEAMVLSLVTKAVKGDTKAFEIIRDTIGEKPAERITLAEIDPKTIEEVERMVTARDA
jgi:hypothetical protein